MKAPFHIHQPVEGFWFRPSDLSVDGDVVYCDFEDGSRYSFHEAYPKTPHLQLLNALDDASILTFVRAWGPLYIHPLEIAQGWTRFSFQDFRVYQAWYRSLVFLLRGLTAPESLRELLLAFLNAADAVQPRSVTTVLDTSPLIGTDKLRVGFGIRESWNVWAASAEEEQILMVSEDAVNTYLCSFRPVVRANGSKDELKLTTGWELADLLSALRWMLWHDLLRGNPVLCCIECGRFFPRDTKRFRTYCSIPCGRRQTNRLWKRKDDAKKKESKAKG